MRLWTLAATASTCLLVALLFACGDSKFGSSGGTSAFGTINTSISDPPTCAAPLGTFSHVFVTIKDVKAHINATAADNDPGFVDLTPNMTPVQVDLLGATTAQCVLAQLATNVQLPAGTYQQIRLILLDNTQTAALGANNQCGTNNGVNCVTLTSDGSIHQVNITSEATTGIKLTPPQISGGSVVVQANQTANLNLSFNACASLLLAANGQFSMKPVVTAGTVLSANNTITGRVVDGTTLAAIAGGKVIATLQQLSNGVDRVVMEVTPDGAGNFVFCPVPTGSYEVVATAVNGANVAYAATVTTGVQPTASLGNIPLIAQPGSGIAASPATVNGTITTTGTSGATTDDITLSALQGVTVGTSNVLVTIPLAAQNSATLTVTTQTVGCASSTTGCASYSLQLPAANPNVGAFSSSGTTYTQNTANPASYTVDALAFVPSSAATPSCVPSEVQASTAIGGAPLTVVGGGSVTAVPINFIACQ